MLEANNLSSVGWDGYSCINLKLKCIKYIALKISLGKNIINQELPFVNIQL